MKLRQDAGGTATTIAVITIMGGITTAGIAVIGIGEAWAASACRRAGHVTGKVRLLHNSGELRQLVEK
jgi:hypothetical protein